MAISAKEELLEFAKKNLYTDKKNLDSVIHSDLVWKIPYEEWKKDDVERVRKKISEIIRDLPFEHRYDLLEIINAFMNKHFGNLGYSELLLEKHRERAEVEIEILKLTQGGTNPELNQGSRENLAEKLHFSTDALKHYLSALQNGQNLLGSDVKIELERGTNIYDSTVHPVFLALNLTEVNFLVNHLRLEYEGTEFESIANQISYDIYRQLSEYGKSRMDSVAENHNLDLTKNKDGKELTKGYHKELDTQGIPYLMKCDKCSLIDKETGSEIAQGYVYKNRSDYYFESKEKKFDLDEKFLSQYQIKPIQR